ncbi:Major facilitator superfamily domain general substrate transporter [Penicillium sp. DV-2018c]|nr:Major facilitator superfamily domain general substrate transporter [Penicillium sp. DV-2018c]
MTIDKRDFDANRPLLQDVGAGHDTDERNTEASRLRPGSRHSRSSADDGLGLRTDDGLLSEVVEELVERDRLRMQKEVIRILSFGWGVITCLGAGSITAFSLYGHLFLTRLHYSQLQVNAVSIAAEIAMYLPVPLFGYLCDRYSPSPLSLFSGVVFGIGYFLAALTYQSGPPVDAGGSGWPFWVMIVAFIAIGTGTSCMYLAAVATCAKNFGRGKHKGIMLAVPIAAFGLSGMWQSQIGTYLFYERLEDGSHGDLDVSKFFVFLAVLLLVIGIVGTFALRIVEEDDKYIDETVEELERSGLLEESDFFRPRNEIRQAAEYGTFSGVLDEEQAHLSDEEREQQRLEKEREEEERRKKNWLLNYETRLFLQDHTMWWLAAGFFLVTGPGESYINNLGTIIPTLTPNSYPPTAPPPAGKPSTHVTTIALTSTIARLLTGSLSDFFAPPATHLFPTIPRTPTTPQSSSPTISRMAFLIPSAILLSLGYLLLASPLPQSHPPLLNLTTALIGSGYGGAFSLAPIIISVVWGVENFATNWGIVAMMPAAGAALWGIVYSAAYQHAVDVGLDGADGGLRDGQCRGWRCYGFWAVGCTVSVWVACLAWVVAWRGWRRRGLLFRFILWFLMWW